MFPVLGHKNSGGGGGGSNVYLVSKRLKLGSTPIADVDFFAPTPKPPPLEAQPGGGAGELSADTIGSSACSEGDVALVFGNEVDGLSGLEEGEMGRALPAVYLPMRDDVIRSYNLSNAVIVLPDSSTNVCGIFVPSRVWWQTNQACFEVARYRLVVAASLRTTDHTSQLKRRTAS